MQEEAIKDAIQKCKYLLWFDTEDSRISVDTKGIDPIEATAVKMDLWDIKIPANDISEKSKSYEEKSSERAK